MNTMPNPLTHSNHRLHNPERAIHEALQSVRDSYVENQVWPTAVKVMDHLLARHVELVDAYAELHLTLPSPASIAMLLDAVVMTAAIWNPGKIDQARAARAELEKTNHRIAEVAHELAELLRQRSALHNTSAFTSSTHFHVVDVIESAAGTNGLYQAYLQEPLLALASRYDLKYWPSLASVVEVIAADAEASRAQASDRLTQAATAGPRRASKADFFKALFVAIKERRSHIPDGYRPSDATLASLASCALDLQPDALLDAAYVKNVRQRLREADDKSEM